MSGGALLAHRVVAPPLTQNLFWDSKTNEVLTQAGHLCRPICPIRTMDTRCGWQAQIQRAQRAQSAEPPFQWACSCDCVLRCCSGQRPGQRGRASVGRGAGPVKTPNSPSVPRGPWSNSFFAGLPHFATSPNASRHGGSWGTERAERPRHPAWAAPGPSSLAAAAC